MKKIKTSLVSLIFSVLTLCWAISNTYAQCPMCKAAAESNLKEGGKHALGLNHGILYLLVVPYLLIGSIGIWWWRNNYRREREAESAE